MPEIPNVKSSVETSFGPRVWYFACNNRWTPPWVKSLQNLTVTNLKMTMNDNDKCKRNKTCVTERASVIANKEKLQHTATVLPLTIKQTKYSRWRVLHTCLIIQTSPHHYWQHNKTNVAQWLKLRTLYECCVRFLRQIRVHMKSKTWWLQTTLTLFKCSTCHLCPHYFIFFCLICGHHLIMAVGTKCGLPCHPKFVLSICIYF